MQNKLEIKTTPKQSIRVNKAFVLLIAAVLTTIFLLAIISAFNTGPATSAKEQNVIGANKLQKPTVSSSTFKDLPESYHDVNAIKKYSASGKDEEYEQLRQEFESLKSNQEILEQQLMNMHKVKPVIAVGEDPQTMQAKNSALFFVGAGGDQGMLSMGGGASSSMPMPPSSYPGSGTQPQSGTGPVTAQQATFFNQQNENAQKLAVIKASDNPEDIYDLHNMVTPVSPYEIQAGTVIPATLITGINTTLAGTVVAQVRQNMYDTVIGKFLLVPKGSKLLGEYDSHVSYGQRRVLLTFNRIIRPDGSSILLGKPSGTDLQGSSGIEGNVDNHWMRVLGAATISTILSVGAGVASDRYAVNGNNIPNSRQSAFLGASSGVSQVGQNIANRALDVQPTITLPAGYQFNVIVKKDMVLTPYKKRN